MESGPAFKYHFVGFITNIKYSVCTDGWTYKICNVLTVTVLGLCSFHILCMWERWMKVIGGFCVE